MMAKVWLASHRKMQSIFTDNNFNKKSVFFVSHYVFDINIYIRKYFSSLYII